MEVGDQVVYRRQDGTEFDAEVIRVKSTVAKLMVGNVAIIVDLDCIKPKAEKKKSRSKKKDKDEVAPPDPADEATPED